jgi:hypothetical protein
MKPSQSAAIRHPWRQRYLLAAGYVYMGRLHRRELFNDARPKGLSSNELTSTEFALANVLTVELFAEEENSCRGRPA